MSEPTGASRDFENQPNVAVVVTPLRQAAKLAAALKLGESQGLELDCRVVESRSGALAVREVPVKALGALTVDDIDAIDFDSLSMDDLLGGTGAGSGASVPDDASALLGGSTGESSDAAPFERNEAPALDPTSVEALAQYVSTLLPKYEVLLLNKVGGKVTATRWLDGKAIGTVAPGLVMMQLDEFTQSLVLGTRRIGEIADALDPATFTPGQTIRGIFNPFKKKPKDSDD
ncbi:hypothetical protein JT358_02575 [Micrococcales bacterium 31B]|nr:hypothetical protein [Micrococcales bacterium 31B]